MKVLLVSFPARYDLPTRPAGTVSGKDAHRQTQFLLGGDFELFERAMNLQLRIVAANAKLRTPEAGALFGFWSRTFSHLSDACAVMSTGSYASCAPLLRTACDCIAAQKSLIAGGFGEYAEWLDGAVRQAPEHSALAFDLGRFRAGSVLAEDERLGGTYRLLTDLSMPHFGSTALQTAPDSGLKKLAISFGDGGFHLGWAELITGWLLLLTDVQLDVAVKSGALGVDETLKAEHETLQHDVAATLANRRRCYVDEVGGLFLFYNWRRAASGVPKRVVL